MFCRSHLDAFFLKLLKESALAAKENRLLPFCTEAVKGQPAISSSEWGGETGTTERQRGAAAVIAGCASHGDVQGKVAL